jgi:hypothetical protein
LFIILHLGTYVVRNFQVLTQFMYEPASGYIYGTMAIRQTTERQTTERRTTERQILQHRMPNDWAPNAAECQILKHRMPNDNRQKMIVPTLPNLT